MSRSDDNHQSVLSPVEPPLADGVSTLPEGRVVRRENRMAAVSSLHPNPRNAKRHPRRQIKTLAKSISAFGFGAPLIADENGTILAGHARLEAAKLLGLDEVPVVVLYNLSEAQRRGLMLADNRIAEDAVWDRGMLAIELPELQIMLEELDLSIDATGFEVGEVDAIVADTEDSPDPADEIDEAWAKAPPVTRAGDLWILDTHRLLCGDARSPGDLRRLLEGSAAAAVITDPPFDFSVSSAGGRGKIKHSEFKMASGEMTSEEFVDFLRTVLSESAAVCKPGAVAFIFIDWRNVDRLLQVGREVLGELLNVIVWVKTNAGQGSFYRSQHEMIGVFRVGDGPDRNNVRLGRHGRNRSNVWRYPGANTFRAGRMADLEAHPTVKPVRLVADAIKDVTARGEIVLDAFMGSGTTILAAETTGRRGYGLEIEPIYCDVTIRRWQAQTGRDAILSGTDVTFDEVAAERSPEAPVARSRRRTGGSR